MPPHKSNSHKNTSCVLTARPQKAIKNKTIFRICHLWQKNANLFQKHVNKSAWKINSYFSIITQTSNTSKTELAVNCNKSKCIQIQVHFHFALTLNTIALRWPTRVSRATCGSLRSFMRPLRNYIPEVPLNNMHNSYNKCLVKFRCCHVGGLWYLQ